ncbi:LacI family DNA-binding transcriptional regulator [Granulicella mallensis]|uniref:LacI family transcriptional regulator n=1 Tax=Granulicella mallensis TaxID=940614 RepID=A0A7W8E7R0_9BACT|nr:substrate-binding domain-containing protein [Granulicella mallensis]MBB5061936.1 LacI family transcriptional regulator [Granulicella mallensis]
MMSPGVQERVFLAAKEFEVSSSSNLFAPSPGASFSIGVVVPEVADGYLASVLNGIEKELFETGYLHSVVCHHGREDLLTAYAASLVDSRVDGLIFVNSMLPPPTNVPSVALSNHQTAAWATRIHIDHDLAAELTLQHLLGLGHRRIAFIRGQKESLDAKSRWTSLCYAAKTLGLDIHEELCLQLEENQWSPRLGYPVVRDLLARRTDFTAICCFNDFVAIGAIKAIREAGLSCPDDISVIGFDDIESAEYCEPSLTTIRQPLKHMGSLAARVLLNKIHYPEAKASKSILMQPSLIVRSSTGPVNSERLHIGTTATKPGKTNRKLTV